MPEKTYEGGGEIFSPSDWTLADWKKAITQHYDATAIVNPSPLFLLDWEITAKSNGTGDVKFYDGQGAGSRLRMRIQVTKSSTLCQDYSVPRYFTQGLYLVLGGDVEHICLHYLVDPTV